MNTATSNTENADHALTAFVLIVFGVIFACAGLCVWSAALTLIGILSATFGAAMYGRSLSDQR